MASSLKELIEEWKRKAFSLRKPNPGFYPTATEASIAVHDCISDLRDTLLVMEAEEVRKGTFSVSCSNGHILPDRYWGKECPVCTKEAEEVRKRNA